MQRAVFFAGFAVASLLPFTAFAQSADDAARAQVLFEQGNRAMDAHDYATACAKFEATQSMVRGIGVTLRLADCLEKQGRIASAWAQFRSGEQMCQDKHDARESVARDRAAALEPHLPKVRLMVAQPAPEGLHVTQDGHELPAGTWATDVPIDPGPHVFTASAPGYQSWEAKRDFAADRPAVEVDVPALVKEPQTAAREERHEAAPPQKIEAPPPSPPQQSGSRSIPTVAWIGFGVGAAGIISGSITGSMTLVKASQIKSDCPSGACTSQTQLDNAKAAQVIATISDVSFIVGGVGALVGVGAYLFLGKNGDERSAVVTFTPNGAAVSGTF
jgi:hypothetical protein